VSAGVANAPVARKGSRQACNFLRVVAREVLHVQATKRVSDEDIRRLDVLALQFGA